MKIAYVHCSVTPAQVMQEIETGKDGQFEVYSFVSDYSCASEGVVWTHPDWNCEARFHIFRNAGKPERVIVETAMSGYHYEILFYGEYCRTHYEGAYRGMFEQDMLPTLNPALTGKEIVQGTQLGVNVPMLEYAEKQEVLHNFKKEQGFRTSYSAHPRCVKKLLVDAV